MNISLGGEPYSTSTGQIVEHRIPYCAHKKVSKIHERLHVFGC